MNKTEIAAVIGEITGNTPDPDAMTKAELEDMLKVAQAGVAGLAGPDSEFLEAVRRAVEEPELIDIQRRKMNRGSTRRIHRATENVIKALSDFSKEIDQQVFAVDGDGRRSGEHPLIEDLRQMKAHIKSSVSSFT